MDAKKTPQQPFEPLRSDLRELHRAPSDTPDPDVKPSYDEALEGLGTPRVPRLADPVTGRRMHEHDARSAGAQVAQDDSIPPSMEGRTREAGSRDSGRARPPATLRDVAREAGVSIKTVSRVVNGEAHVTPKTASRVRDAIRSLGYVPNISARRLVQRRSFILAVVYEAASWNWLGSVQDGVAQRCRESGYEVLLRAYQRDCPDPQVEIESVLRLVEQGSADGLILLPPVGDVDAITSRLLERGLPYVAVQPDSTDGEFLSVRPSDREGMTVMARYLLSLGHRRIGFVEGPQRERSGRDRLAGFKEALMEAGIPVDPALIRPGDYTHGTGIEAGRYLLDLPERPTAVLASNDDMAAGVLSAAYERHLRVPDDLSVAGFDDSLLARQVAPPLTTVRQPTRAIGYRAATLLLDALDGPPDAVHHQLETELVVRASTAPAK